MSEQNKLPTIFWVIAIVGLIWNLMGVTAFFTDVLMSEDTLATKTVAVQELYKSTPSWIYIVYGIAVFGGALGCVGLLLKKGWAEMLFLASLIAIIVQMAYSLLFTKASEVHGMTSIIMPAILIILGGFLWYYTRQCKAKGWLS